MGALLYMNKNDEFLIALTPKGKHMAAQQISLLFAMLCWEHMDSKNITVHELVEQLFEKTISFCDMTYESGSKEEIKSAKEIEKLTRGQYKAWKKAMASF